MFPKDMSRQAAVALVILTSGFTLTVYLDISLLFYDGIYFWAVTKLLLFCLFFSLVSTDESKWPGSLVHIGLGPFKMYNLERKKRVKTLYVPSSPKKRTSFKRSERTSAFHLDANAPLLLSPAIYRSERLVTFDSALGAHLVSQESQLVRLEIDELFDKDGDIARTVHQHVLFYVGPQLVSNIARYNSMVAKHDHVWVGSSLRSQGLSSYLFWITSIIAILTFPFYYIILITAQKRTIAFENRNRIAMEVELEDDKISVSAGLPAVAPARGSISLARGGPLESAPETKEPLSNWCFHVHEIKEAGHDPYSIN